MPSKSVYVQVDLEDFDTEELLEELKIRNYKYDMDDEKLADSLISDKRFETASWLISRGELFEASIELERKFHQLKGLSDLVKKKTNT